MPKVMKRLLICANQDCLDRQSFFVKDGPNQIYCPKCRDSRKEIFAKFIKNEALAHYGKNRKLQCSWESCEIIDVDMLTLDHINDDGAQKRKIKGQEGGGRRLYARLRKAGWPPGYQTLCANHQMKKYIAWCKRTLAGKKKVPAP
jgi:hypothetical protein